MKFLLTSTVRHLFITAGMLCFALTVTAATPPEQVDPQVQNQQVPTAQPNNQHTQTPQQPAQPPKKKEESPLEDMWNGVLDFFYGSESDSTSTSR